MLTIVIEATMKPSPIMFTGNHNLLPEERGRKLSYVNVIARGTCIEVRDFVIEPLVNQLLSPIQLR